MPSLFDYDDYRKYLRAVIQDKGAQAYGLKGKWALALNVSSSLMSQILSGKKGLTPDQASDLTDHLGFSELESDYFHLLVEWDRAATQRYQQKLKQKILNRREDAKKIRDRVPEYKELSDAKKAIYYSSWLYTGIRNLTALNDVRNIEDISLRLNVDREIAARVVHFLLESGLCLERADGTLTYGPSQTHVENNSPFVNKHHQNWRFRGIQQMEMKRSKDLFFTSPMSLSEEAYDLIRKLLPEVVQKVFKISGPSESETTACLNIDFFNY
ncbi:MAG: hypothetical protein CL676_13705 [Bdellovibrionaceae bacterium]|nr:hypothetical protein [Pseudobdellovibrionaceae bacterium]|tara:strand:+ start:19381 stop:20190 length:810 start_codon:yes stop_codon:yes gene_type:complete